MSAPPAQQPPMQAQPANGPLDDKDVDHWKTRINDVLARPGEHVNSKSAEDSQSWNSTFFGCFDPIDLCLMTYCVPCVTFGKTHHRVHKNGNLEGYEPINTTCLMFCASGCVGLHWVPMAMERAAIREKYHLQGDCVTDILASCFCGLCSLIQADKEATYREPLLAQGGVKEQYQAGPGMTYPGGEAAPQQ